MGLLRRRSALVKFILKGMVLVGVIWVTILFLLYSEQRVNSIDGNEIIVDSPINSGLVREKVIGNINNFFTVQVPSEKRTRDNRLKNKIDNSLLEVGDGVLVPPRDLAEEEMMAKGQYGEMGRPIHLPANLTGEMKRLVDEGWAKNAFNQYVSDLISVHRQLPDPRDAWCKEPGRYLDDLPQTSVIICFHNEAWSVLLRTIHSVLNRSPPSLLKEIILVDDFSDMVHLKKKLEDYVSQYPKVKLIRAKKREGLIRARLLGATHATAPVATFLDSHCECTTGSVGLIYGSLQVFYNRKGRVRCGLLNVPPRGVLSPEARSLE
ncbi:UNVERIFIED_CONTAM: hypothetical protein PYX00_010436 [Menopon gallinae]|uniref:Glycosyltransferase 2-like domain-containing protein n=1 Tax=Menopon gallinae TaxID=328185 RepID=A0AAW2HFP0_9NEOP